MPTRGMTISLFGRQHRRPEPGPEVEPALDQPEAEPLDDAELDPFAEADALAEMSDEDFEAQLRADVEGVREGTVKSIIDVMRPALEDRPWARKHKRRDRKGRAF